MLTERTDRAWFRCLIDIRPRNGAGLSLQPRSLHGATSTEKNSPLEGKIFAGELFIYSHWSSSLLRRQRQTSTIHLTTHTRGNGRDETFYTQNTLAGHQTIKLERSLDNCLFVCLLGI